MKLNDENEILRIRNEMTEFDLKLKNFDYEKQLKSHTLSYRNYVQNIEK